MLTNLTSLPSHDAKCIFKDDMVSLYLDSEPMRISKLNCLLFSVKSIKFKERYPQSIATNCSNEVEILNTALQSVALNLSTCYCPIYHGLSGGSSALHTCLSALWSDHLKLSYYTLDLSLGKDVNSLSLSYLPSLDRVRESEIDLSYQGYLEAFADNTDIAANRPYTKDYFAALIAEGKSLALRDASGNLAAVEIIKLSKSDLYVDYCYRMPKGHSFTGSVYPYLMALELQQAQALGLKTISLHFMATNQRIASWRHQAGFQSDLRFEICTYLNR